MDYWTLMVITILSGDLDGSQTSIPFPSMEACNEATQEIGAVLPYDFSMACLETQTASGSVKPVGRGEVEE